MIFIFFYWTLWLPLCSINLYKILQIHFKSSPIKVRYGETDQMGVVHHSNYLRYFEVARIEWLMQLGVSYNTMEEEGVMMPVISAHIDYKQPAKFEDELSVLIQLEQVPLVKMVFNYQVLNQHNDLVCEASTTLAFMNAMNRRPIRCPETFKAVFAAVVE